ncbi:MAG: hypothetical protein NC412_02425 [Roseburia sp.]|nr:hypothetical protein [Roseburia sp.]MCM1278193.1 hypothetical protein [Robinsoniella sp.]
MNKKYGKTLTSLILLVIIMINSIMSVEAKTPPYKTALSFSYKTFANNDTISKSFRITGKTIHWFKFNSGSMGEYNIFSTGNVDTKVTLYKKTFTGITKVASDDNSGGSKNFKLNVGLEKNKTYYLEINYKNRGYANIYLQVNYDKYSGGLFSTKGGSWEPYSNTYQPYALNGQFYKKVTYLTPAQSAIYAAGLLDKKYLKMLNSGVQITALLASMGISKYSVVGRAIIKLGEKPLIRLISTGLSAWGVSMLPPLETHIIRIVQQKTCNYNYGLSITTIWTQRGMYTNSYEKWNVKNTSVYGKRCCRGRFKAGDIKVGGWY